MDHIRSRWLIEQHCNYYTIFDFILFHVFLCFSHSKHHWNESKSEEEMFTIPYASLTSMISQLIVIDNNLNNHFKSGFNAQFVALSILHSFSFHFLSLSLFPLPSLRVMLKYFFFKTEIVKSSLNASIKHDFCLHCVWKVDKSKSKQVTNNPSLPLSS